MGKVQKRRTVSLRPGMYLLAGDLSRVAKCSMSSLLERLLAQEAQRMSYPAPTDERVARYVERLGFEARTRGAG